MGTAEGVKSQGTNQEQSAPGERGFLEYRVLAAAYLALLLAPLVAALAPGPGVDVTSWGFAAVGGLVGGGLGFVVASRYTVRRLLTDLPTAVLLTVAPLGFVVWTFALFANNPGKTVGTLLLRPNTVGILATIPAAIALVKATREAAAYRVAQSSVHVEFTARTAQRTRRLQNWSMAGGLGAITGLAVILYRSGMLDVVTLAVLTGAVVTFAIILLRTTTHTVAVTADGLAFDDSFTEWSDFESYEITDDSLVLSRSSRLLADVAFDLHDLDSVADVQSALDQHLPERS